MVDPYWCGHWPRLDDEVHDGVLYGRNCSRRTVVRSAAISSEQVVLDWSLASFLDLPAQPDLAVTARPDLAAFLATHPRS